MFFDSVSKLSNFETLRLITTHQKKVFNFIATSFSFTVSVSSSSASFILFEDCILFDKKRLKVFEKHFFSVMCHSFKLVKCFLSLL